MDLGWHPILTVPHEHDLGFVFNLQIVVIETSRVLLEVDFLVISFNRVELVLFQERLFHFIAADKGLCRVKRNVVLFVLERVVNSVSRPLLKGRHLVRQDLMLFRGLIFTFTEIISDLVVHGLVTLASHDHLSGLDYVNIKVIVLELDFL
jgi:hypothetical protein